MSKYKVMSSISKTQDKDFYNGVEFDYIIEDDSLGIEVNCLGGIFNITQNGKILVLVNDNWVLTIMNIEPEVKIVVRKPEVNKDFEIFFDTKEFGVNNTKIIRDGVTYKEFFRTIENEWSLVQALRPEVLPMKYNNDMKLITFINNWKFRAGDFMLLKDGSWGRENDAGQSF